MWPLAEQLEPPTLPSTTNTKCLQQNVPQPNARKETRELGASNLDRDVFL